MLKLIVGIPAKPKPDYCMIYLNAFIRKVAKWKEMLEENPGTVCKEIHKQILFYGIRYYNHQYTSKERIEGALWREIQLADFLLAEIGDLTPTELITIFPIEKTFDGSRWQIKDYFFTMDCLRKIGMDTKIGDNAQELIWDYENKDVRMFTLNRIHVYSDAMKLQTGQSVGEAWAETMGLAVNTMCLDKVTGRQYMMDKDEKTIPIKKKTPRYLKLHRGAK
jgi:hypothetical protein